MRVWFHVLFVSVLFVFYSTLCVSEIKLERAPLVCSHYDPQHVKEIKLCRKLVDDAVAYVDTISPPYTTQKLKKLQERGVTREGLYVFVVDLQTFQVLIHPAIPAMIGADFRNIESYDHLHLLTIFETALTTCSDREAWVTYIWRVPNKLSVARKYTYLREHNGLIIGCGYYP